MTQYARVRLGGQAHNAFPFLAFGANLLMVVAAIIAILLTVPKTAQR